MPLAELLMERFKRKTRAVENPLITSVGTTATLILKNNPNRLAFIIHNLGAYPVFLGFTSDVSITKGARIDPNGGAYSMIWDEDFDATAWAIWAIADGGTSAVYTIEIVEYSRA